MRSDHSVVRAVYGWPEAKGTLLEVSTNAFAAISIGKLSPTYLQSDPIHRTRYSMGEMAVEVALASNTWAV